MNVLAFCILRWAKLFTFLLGVLLVRGERREETPL